MPSPTFFRLSLVCYGLVIVCIGKSGFYMPIAIALVMACVVHLFFLYRNPAPYPAIKKLWVRMGEYHLIEQDGRVHIYESAVVLLRCGVFFLLHLQGAEGSRTLVLFFDQIPADAFRLLCFLEKIHTA